MSFLWSLLIKLGMALFTGELKVEVKREAEILSPVSDIRDDLELQLRMHYNNSNDLHSAINASDIERRYREGQGVDS